MNTALLILLFVLVIMLLGVMALFFGVLPGFGGGSSGGNMRSMMSSQRTGMTATNSAGAKRDAKAALAEAVSAAPPSNKNVTQLTLPKRLRFAQWKMTPTMFNVLMVVVSVVAFALVRIKLNIVLQLMSLLTGPLFMNWLLNSAMDRRSKAFDADYPQFLLSLVGLLKTGLNPMTGLETAAYGLQQGSLVKSEVETMLERLRFGVSEDKSIGAFGEDIFHTEIELFVQALLLSRRVGGTLSDTLERLSKQVRKRQYFKATANAAVGMQRGSIWIILGILGALEGYIYLVYPEAIVGAWNDEVGKQILQTGIVLILLGVFWIRQVTKIRV